MDCQGSVYIQNKILVITGLEDKIHQVKTVKKSLRCLV